ncbi:hypothetical protein ACI1TW_09855 [Lactococcus garvieae]|uniref:hypothetical protein n=1 Tax=Lactococcus garvieae TaxID=1363 RepID=UPI003853819A
MKKIKKIKSAKNNSFIVPGTNSSLKQKNYCSPYIIVKVSQQYQGSLLAKRILEEESKVEDTRKNNDIFLEIIRMIFAVVYLIILGSLVLGYSLVGGLAIIISCGENIFLLFLTSGVVCIIWYLIYILYINLLWLIFPNNFRRLVKKYF